jgi:hypothetical protein
MSWLTAMIQVPLGTISVDLSLVSRFQICNILVTVNSQRQHEKSKSTIKGFTVDTNQTKDHKPECYIDGFKFGLV